jgi:hypothetical protein
MADGSYDRIVALDQSATSPLHPSREFTKQAFAAIDWAKNVSIGFLPLREDCATDLPVGAVCR